MVWERSVDERSKEGLADEEMVVTPQERNTAVPKEKPQAHKVQQKKLLEKDEADIEDVEMGEAEKKVLEGNGPKREEPKSSLPVKRLLDEFNKVAKEEINLKERSAHKTQEFLNRPIERKEQEEKKVQTVTVEAKNSEQKKLEKTEKNKEVHNLEIMKAELKREEDNKAAAKATSRKPEPKPKPKPKHAEAAKACPFDLASETSRTSNAGIDPYRKTYNYSTHRRIHTTHALGLGHVRKSELLLEESRRDYLRMFKPLEYERYMRNARNSTLL